MWFRFRFRFRFVLAWLLVVALPIQGMAAATMLNCGPAHHRMTQAVDAPSMETHHHPHDMQAASTGHETHHHDLAKFSKAKCSACAACCIGAGLPTSALVLEPVALTGRPSSLIAAPQAGFFTDGPDRPPRSLRA